MDFANGDIPNRVEFIQRMAQQFQGAAHNEELILRLITTYLRQNLRINLLTK